jgi:sulfofructose kinase
VGKRVLCVGNCVLDQIFEVERIPRAAEKVLALASRESGGGPAATAAVAIARLGGDVAFAGVVGEDPPGRMLRDRLNSFGVDTRFLMNSPEVRTPTPIVLVDPSGERCIVVQRKKAVDYELPSDAISSFSLVLADTRWPDGCEMVLALAHAAGVTAILDADGGDPAMVRRLAALCDHVIFSEQGLRDLVGDGEIPSQLRRAAALCNGIVAVTVGVKGSFWLIDGAVAHVDAFPVQALDTTGCGDVFHGAYALALAEGMEPLSAARFASAAAAQKAARGSGWDGMPDRASVGRMAAGL